MKKQFCRNEFVSRHPINFHLKVKLIFVLVILSAFPDRSLGFFRNTKFRPQLHRLKAQPTRYYFNQFPVDNQWTPVNRPIPLTPRPHFCKDIATHNQTTSLPPRITSKFLKPIGSQPAPAFLSHAKPSWISSHGFPDNYRYAPPTTPVPYKKCKGRKNLIDDIGVFGLITALTSSTIGMYTIVVNSMTSNNVGIISSILSLIIWLPSQLISILDLQSQHAFAASNFLNGLSFVNTMYSFLGVVFGTADVLASVAGETIGIISLVLSIAATFPDYLDEIIEMLYKMDRRLEYYIENYGCSVPSVFHSFGGYSLYEKLNRLLILSTKTMQELGSKLGKKID